MTAFTRMSRMMVLLAGLSTVHAYFLFSAGVLVEERADPIVNPGQVAGHVHTILGGSNFGLTVTTALLRKSQCTSTSIKQDKSAYWAPKLYFHHRDGNFTGVNGGAVIYYLFPGQAGSVTAFPEDFRMISGDPILRSYSPTHAQRAITFLCLDFNGVSTTHNELPRKKCPSGIRAQVNFPSCWDGKNLDSPNHKSHVAFPSEGPDQGSCKDPKYPVTLPRIFLEMYLGTQDFDNIRNQAMDPDQPFVYAHGDGTGDGYHADFYNGWERGVLERAVDECNCNIYGDPTCCAQKGIFELQDGGKCKITPVIDEKVTGTIPKLPGNNPIQGAPGPAVMLKDPNTPAILSPSYVYTGNTPPMMGTIVTPAVTGKPTSTSFIPVPNPAPTTATPVNNQPSSSAAVPPAPSVTSSTAAQTTISAAPSASPSAPSTTPASSSAVQSSSSIAPINAPIASSSVPSATSASSTAVQPSSSTAPSVSPSAPTATSASSTTIQYSSSIAPIASSSAPSATSTNSAPAQTTVASTTSLAPSAPAVTSTRTSSAPVTTAPATRPGTIHFPVFPLKHNARRAAIRPAHAHRNLKSRHMGDF